MIDSELGEIPEGWKVDRLSEIIVFEGGAQPPKSEHIYEPRDGYVRFIQNRDYSNSSHITYIKESKKNKLCEVYDIMMDKYGDVGVPRWGLVGAYNVALAKIVPKIKNSREYLRSYFSQRAVFSLLSASAQASTRGSLNEGTFKGVTLIIPDEITLERFEKLQSKFLSKILFNNAEVETLSQLRDTLLPKLMKGDVQVKGFKD
jgi:type I restriction enzyme S subunit